MCQASAPQHFLVRFDAELCLRAGRLRLMSCQLSGPGGRRVSGGKVPEQILTGLAGVMCLPEQHPSGLGWGFRIGQALSPMPILTLGLLVGPQQQQNQSGWEVEGEMEAGKSQAIPAASCPPVYPFHTGALLGHACLAKDARGLSTGRGH